MTELPKQLEPAPGGAANNESPLVFHKVMADVVPKTNVGVPNPGAVPTERGPMAPELKTPQLLQLGQSIPGAPAFGGDTPEQRRPASPVVTAQAGSERSEQTTLSKPQPTGDQPIFTVVPSNRPFDPTKRSVVVLDEFEKSPIEPDPNNPGKWMTHGQLMINGPKYSLTHGEFIARTFEQQGYNVVRLQENMNYIAPGTLPFAQLLQAVDAGVKDGTIPLTPGDKINLSLANPPAPKNTGLYEGVLGETSYAGINRTLGLNPPIDKDNLNLPETKARVLQALEDRLNDPSLNPVIRVRLQQALDTNKIVTKLHDEGIDVLKAAGNHGPEFFSLDFLSAERLGALNEVGKVTDYSQGSSSYALASNDIFYLGFNPYSPEPLANDRGIYFIPGTSTTLDPRDFGGRHFESDSIPPDQISPEFLTPPGMPGVSLSTLSDHQEGRLDRELLDIMTGDYIEKIYGTSFAASVGGWVKDHAPPQK